MGRERKPTAILDAKGAYILHPERRHAGEPQSNRPLGPPPKWLSKEEKRVWKDLAKEALPGVLMCSDRNAFELLVRLTYKLRTDFEHMTGAAMGQFISLCSRFALTPADRSKVSVDKPKESALNKFLNSRAKQSVAKEQPTESIN